MAKPPNLLKPKFPPMTDIIIRILLSLLHVSDLLQMLLIGKMQLGIQLARNSEKYNGSRVLTTEKKGRSRWGTVVGWHRQDNEPF